MAAVVAVALVPEPTHLGVLEKRMPLEGVGEEALSIRLKGILVFVGVVVVVVTRGFFEEPRAVEFPQLMVDRLLDGMLFSRPPLIMTSLRAAPSPMRTDWPRTVDA